jgi:hypothetical protein
VPEYLRFERFGTAICDGERQAALKDRDAMEAMEFLETSAMLQKQARYLELERPAS